MIKTFRKIRALIKPEMSHSDLVSILREMDMRHPAEIRTLALKKLLSWMRLPVSTTTESTLPEHIHSRNLRFRFLLQFIDHNPKEKTFFVENLRNLFDQGVATRLYCLTGVAENTGFFSELGDRLVSHILPDIYGEKDLAELFKIIFTEPEDAEWFETSTSIILPALSEIVVANNISLQGLIDEIGEALIILGAQISSLGVSKGMRKRLRTKKLSDSSFVTLNKVINASQGDDLILREVALCQVNLQRVRERAESTGVSVDLVFNLERLSALLGRVEMLVRLRNTESSESKQQIIAFFIAGLIRAEIKRQSVKEFLREHLQMLTKKIVERAGEKGDHYIASTPAEKRHLFVAASWAGVLTAFTTVIKALIGHYGFPLMFEWFFYFINYAVGFLLMQRWHLALSSKQPAFTASALSRKFESFMQTKELSDVISEVRKISYSQFLASIANLLLVVPAVMALDWGHYFVHGQHLVSVSYARQILVKHNLLTSGTLFYAAFTGVLLWLSSVVAGWIENWIVFRSVPQMMKESSFLQGLVGKDRIDKVAQHFPATMGAAAGNLSIAFFLATPIIFGKFTGIPLDIRHVTLATGTITLALNTLPWDITVLPLLAAMLLSIFMMGLLNFGVSFYCSLRMAAIARGVPSRYLAIIFRYAFRRSTKAPV